MTFFIKRISFSNAESISYLFEIIMIKNSGSIISYSGGFLVKSNQFLLGKRSDSNATYPGVWDMFGGHIEPEEDLLRH